MKKMNYEKPLVEVIELNPDDILTISGTQIGSSSNIYGMDDEDWLALDKSKITLN